MNPSIANAEFYHWPATVQLLELLDKAQIEARFVGGCVRDALLGRSMVDVDLAGPTPPHEVLHRLQNLGQKVIPTGIEHGTVTIVIDHRHFELTTLRRDVDCDGRHAIVAYTDSWEEDARRRDFTINAMYADRHGQVYDYHDGLKDLRARRLLFIGQAEDRIKEDALRILRLFRFQAQLGFSVPPALYAVCKKRGRYLSAVSRERICHEIFKLLAASDPLAAWHAMWDAGITPKLMGEHVARQMEDVLRIEGELKLGNLQPLHRLALLAYLSEQPDGYALRELFKLSNQQTHLLLHVLANSHQIHADVSIKQARRWHYQLGSEIYLLCITAAAAKKQHNSTDGLEGFQRLAEDAQHWQPPVFPVKGADLIARGHAPGEALGAMLQAMETRWMESGFELDKDALLAASNTSTLPSS